MFKTLTREENNHLAFWGFKTLKEYKAWHLARQIKLGVEQRGDVVTYANMERTRTDLTDITDITD